MQGWVFCALVHFSMLPIQIRNLSISMIILNCIGHCIVGAYISWIARYTLFSFLFRYVCCFLVCGLLSFQVLVELTKQLCTLTQISAEILKYFILLSIYAFLRFFKNVFFGRRKDIYEALDFLLFDMSVLTG